MPDARFPAIPTTDGHTVYLFGMTVKKIGVSLPEDLHIELTAWAETGKIPSISGHIVALLEAERVRTN